MQILQVFLDYPGRPVSKVALVASLEEFEVRRNCFRTMLNICNQRFQVTSQRPQVHKGLYVLFKLQMLVQNHVTQSIQQFECRCNTWDTLAIVYSPSVLSQSARVYVHNLFTLCILCGHEKKVHIKTRKYNRSTAMKCLQGFVYDSSPFVMPNYHKKVFPLS